MLEENAVPIQQRYLNLEGRAASSVLRTLERKSWVPRSATAVCCFVSFAYADLPLGKTFDRLFPRAHYLHGRQVRCMITAATQQFFEPLDEIPHGWKTICWLDFPAGLPEMIGGLLVVETWYESPPDTHLLLSSEATWRALVRAGNPERTD